jgi:HSP20 family protein
VRRQRDHALEASVSTLQRKDDINFTIEENEVAISAEAKRERDVNEKEKMLLSERFSGNYYRGLPLGHKIDEGRAQARYVDGVLELTLPKSPDSMPKKISVH